MPPPPPSAAPVHLPALAARVSTLARQVADAAARLDTGAVKLAVAVRATSTTWHGSAASAFGSYALAADHMRAGTAASLRSAARQLDYHAAALALRARDGP